MELEGAVLGDGPLVEYGSDSASSPPSSEASAVDADAEAEVDDWLVATCENPLLAADDDLGDSSGELDLPGKRADNRVRKTSLKLTSQIWTTHPRGSNLSRSQLDELEQEIADVECFGGSWYGKNSEPGGQGWKSRSEKVGGEKVLSSHVRVRACPFAKESGCPCAIREVFDIASALYNLERNDRPHCDHTKSNRKVRAICFPCSRAASCCPIPALSRAHDFPLCSLRSEACHSICNSR